MDIPLAVGEKVLILASALLLVYSLGCIDKALSLLVLAYAYIYESNPSHFFSFLSRAWHRAEAIPPTSLPNHIELPRSERQNTHASLLVAIEHQKSFWEPLSLVCGCFLWQKLYILAKQLPQLGRDYLSRCLLLCFPCDPLLLLLCGWMPLVVGGATAIAVG